MKKAVIALALLLLLGPFVGLLAIGVLMNPADLFQLKCRISRL